MATTAPAPGHRRNKSASVLKSIIGHKRTPSDGTPLHKPQPDSQSYHPSTALQSPLLPPDHPHSQLRAAPRTEHIPTDVSASRKSQDTKARPTRSLHKKTLSSVSLRSLGKEKDRAKERQAREPSRTRGEDSVEDNLRKKKSAANLVAMFGKGRHKDTKQTPGDKENTTPPSSANAPGPAHTPIWAEFSSTPMQEITTTSKVPLNDQRRSIEEEIALYTPRDYSPSKQRNFFDYGQPSLQKRPLTKERPKSTILPGNASATSLIDNWSRKKSMDRERTPLSDTKGNETRIKDGASMRNSGEEKKAKEAKQAANATKKQNRVMAAVAALNGKSKQAEAKGTKLDPKTVDAEFEEVLESRNIPVHQRAAMRTLKIEVKADFIRTHKLDTPQSSRVASAHSTVGETTGKQSVKHTLSRNAKSRDGSSEDEKVPLQSTVAGNSSKRERPRSRTFTFNRSDSPTKKQKGEAISGDRKASSKSTAIPKSPSTRSLASNASDRSLSKGSKTILPNEFITYLKKTLKPQEVEVGKLHKLRLLLRNETVEWVDNFIEEGGMTELVGLLHRIMEVEWREDHEDTLLHELLRCLKGLCTTDSALKQLTELAPTLFPALLGMLFDEEHKGPSEFTTRELIVQIVFAHISMAPESELHTRATELLKYLKDPVKEKESSTVPFILQMHQPRPYQVWCKEITNVTKEVFWIFIHHLNVVPLPPALTPAERAQPYAKIHFPGQRAIVPAAPYVGGVEWDATNYIATHLDLVNGLLASLPTREDRNDLRNELKVSGFEKLMGHLRACNPKYYGAVHDSVKVWIGAALVDDWDVRTVRMGSSEGKPASPVKQSPKKRAEKPPQIQAPRMDVSLGLGLGFDKDIAIGHDKKRDDDWI